MTTVGDFWPSIYCYEIALSVGTTAQKSKLDQGDDDRALQIILDLCIPEKELAKTRSQISFIYFQRHSWYSVRNYVIPKGIMKTRLEPRLPRKSSWKSINYYTLDLNSGHLHRKHVFCHWTIKARYTINSHIAIHVILVDGWYIYVSNSNDKLFSES